MAGEHYGDAWDQMPVVIQLCLNCKYDDCTFDEGCPERKRLIRQLKTCGAAAEKDRRLVVRGKIYVIDGIGKTFAEWCEEYGIEENTVRYRMKQGQTLEKALGVKYTHGGARNRGRAIRIGDEVKCMTEWMETYHIHRTTVERYAQKHGCEKREAVRALCEIRRKSQKLENRT